MGVVSRYEIAPQSVAPLYEVSARL